MFDESSTNEERKWKLDLLRKVLCSEVQLTVNLFSFPVVVPS